MREFGLYQFFSIALSCLKMVGSSWAITPLQPCIRPIYKCTFTLVSHIFIPFFKITDFDSRQD